MVLYKKLYDIDRNGLKRAQKKWKPIFQYTKTAMAGNKKHEIIRVAQENLYMLKRLNERTSVYNVDKWNRDYEASQYYKRSHCQYPSIDFYKTQRCSSFGNMFTNGSKNNTKKNFYSKTQYSNNGFNYTNNTGNKSRKRKKFEDFSYRDLQIGKRSNSEIGDKEERQFKKLDEIESPQEQEQQEVDIQQNQDNQQNQQIENKQEEEKEKEKEEEKEKEQEIQKKENDEKENKDNENKDNENKDEEIKNDENRNDVENRNNGENRNDDENKKEDENNNENGIENKEENEEKKEDVEEKEKENE